MKKLNHKVLAEGEATGHAHRVTKGDLYDNDGRLLLDTPGTEVTHEEHGNQTIPAGKHDVSRVVEFDPFQQEVREVQD